MPRIWISMVRRRLIEIHEQKWLTQGLRRDVTDLLQMIAKWLGYGQMVAATLRKAIHESGTCQVIDLCSGSGGPWPELLPLIIREKPLTVVLTDKFPQTMNGDHSGRVPGGTIVFCEKAVQAEAVPENLRGFRTIFNSFHHFELAGAGRVFRDAVERREGVAIFELAQRKFFTMCSAIFLGLITFFVAPFVRPFRISLLVWTYLVPVLPFIMWFDGVVSCLRAYTARELGEMAMAAAMGAYRWEAGTLRRRFLPVSITYLVGWPK